MDFSHEYLLENIPFFNSFLELEKKGECRVYIVGGAVRDILLKKQLKDIDICIENIDYEKAGDIFSKIIKNKGVSFKDNIRFRKNKIVIDLSKLRGDSIEEDLKHRDFTINNLAISLQGKLIGDRKDLDNHIIRIVFDDTFKADPLRILRGFRFISTFGFDFDDYSLNICKKNIPLLKTVAKERILEELEKLFQGKYLEKALNLMDKANVLRDFIDKSELDNKSLIEGIEKSKDFPLLLSLWTCNKKFIENLGLAVKDKRDVNFYLGLKDKGLENLDYNQLQRFVFFNIKYIDNALIYVKIKLNNETLALEIENIKNNINYEAGNMVNGARLIFLGFKPSPLFTEIIAETSFMLAVNKLEINNIDSFILDNWG